MADAFDMMVKASRDPFDSSLLAKALKHETDPNVIRARNIRPFARQNKDGGTSTHIMSSGEMGGRYFAIPTLFPKDPKDPKKGWTEYYTGESSAAKMKDWKAAIRNWERNRKKNVKGMSKIHSHLQKNMNVKQKLKNKYEIN